MSLETRYRRLLLAYPRGPRRAEMLSTLLDCAPPGRSRPRPREVFNIVVHGVRARLGRPKSRSVVVLAVLASVVFAGFGASAASIVGWHFTPSLRGVADQRGITSLVFPGMPVKTCENSQDVWIEYCPDAPAFVWNPDHEGTRYGYLEYDVAPTASTRDNVAYTNGVRDRLLAAGWRLGSDVRVHPGIDDLDTSVLDGTTADPGDSAREATFWARRDGLVLEFFDAVDPSDKTATARFTLARSAPWWLFALTAAGAVLAAPFGWLLTGWISRRTEVPGEPAVTLVAVLPAWLLAVPVTLGILPLNEQVGRPWEEGLFVGLHAKLVPWPDLGFPTVNPVLALAIAAFAPGLFVAAITRERHRRVAAARRPLV